MTLWGDAPRDERLDEAERILRRYLRHDAVERVVTRPAASLGGRTLRDLAHDDPAAALSAVARMFDFNELDAEPPPDGEVM